MKRNNEFVDMNEQQAKAKILELVKDYYEKFHHVEETFVPGQRISYASRVYDEKEICNLVDSALEFWLTSGHYTEEFENKFAKYLDVKYWWRLWR